MCVPDPFYINIDLTFSVLRSIRIPIPYALNFIAATSDSPTIVLDDSSDKGVDKAETDVLNCLFITLENQSDELSDILQLLKDRGVFVIVKQNTVLFETTGYRYGKANWDETPATGEPVQDSTIIIQFDRADIRAKAAEYGVPYVEVFAEVVIHEILHPGMGDFGIPSGAHGGTSGTSPAIWTTPIGQQTKIIFEDLFDDKPPGWKVPFGWPTDMNAPGCLGLIEDDSAHQDFFNGLTETHNAAMAYPTFDIKWEGHYGL